MKVFILASVAVNDSLKSSYKMIVKAITMNNLSVIDKHVFQTPESIKELSVSQSEVRAKKLIKQMLTCDFVVFEGTVPSTGAGYFLGLALQRSVPVLYLSQDNYRGLFLASANRLIKFRRYNPKDRTNLGTIIQKFIKFARNKSLNNRFNFMINDSMEEFLNKSAISCGVSKADIIRELIYRKMEKS
jgi:hypothetical protein